MKTFQNVGDVVSNAIELHQRAATAYSKLRRKCADQRAKLLLDYMTKHEKKMEKLVTEIARGASANVLGTYIQYTLEEVPQQLLDSLIGDRAEFNEDDIIALGQQVDAYLVALFEAALREEGSSESAADLLKDLLHLEMTEKKAFTRTGNAMFDI